MSWECYLIINPFTKQGIRKAAVPNIPSPKLADGEISVKKEKISSYLFYNVISFSKMTGKTIFFSGKITWIWTCGEISRKSKLLTKYATILNDVK